MIDEIDAFSHLRSSLKELIDFIKQMLVPEIVKSSDGRICGVTVIGIANSIELFKGEYTASSAFN